MPRPPRPRVDTGCYHVIARGNNRQRLFVDDAAFLFFHECLRSAKARCPFQLYHYCLMPNHIHLLLQVVEGHHLPWVMQLVLQKFERWVQHRMADVGPAWQGRDQSSLVTTERSFLEVGRYIERNPLRAGLVTDPKHYPWSSCLYYAYGIADTLVDEDPAYARIGRTAERRQRAYRDFVRLPCQHEETLDRALLRSPTPPLVMEGRLTRVGGGA